MDLGSSVLAVIDVQNGFVNDRSRYAVQPIVELVSRWKETGQPIVFTQFTNKSDSQYERLIGWSKMKTSPETDIVDELQPYVELIIKKNFYSFFNEEGKALAERNEWKTFVLCGISTDSCILKTAIDGFELGYTPLVVTDAIASQAGEEVHKAGLHMIGRNIGRRQLITMEQLL